MFGKKSTVQNDVEFFSLYDSKSKTYNTPMPSMNQETMVRDICNMFRDPSQTQNKHLLNAEDFALFHVGSYNYISGQITPVNPTHVVNLHELRSLVQAAPSNPGIVST